MTRGSPLRQPALAALFVAIVSGVVLPSRCSAQTPSTGDRLAVVQVTGSSRFSSEQIAAATGLRVGSQIGRDDFQRAADDLAKIGRFSSVQYRYGSTDSGIRVEYQVTDAPAVPVWFDNFPWFTDAELTTALKASVPLFDGTAPEGGALLDAISDAIESELAKKEVHGNVTHVLTSSPGGEDHIQLFRIEDGGLNVATVDFGDALAQNDRGIHMRLSDLIGEKYSRAAVVLFEFEQVRPVYFSHGFLRVRLGPPEARIVGAASPGVAITAPIDPGAAYTWRAPTWSGNSVLGMLELTTLIPLHEGEIADAMKAERGWDAIRNAYAQRGYLQVGVNPVPHFDDGAKTISYAVSIAEGPQFHMGKLVLTGLSIEGERRIREAWKISPGAVFDQAFYDEFISSGIKEAFMGLPVHYDKIGKFLQEDPKAATVDVMLDFQ
jgi:outer membrane protein assembly factor BamA